MQAHNKKFCGNGGKAPEFPIFSAFKQHWSV
jgi:hypothetical protein